MNPEPYTFRRSNWKSFRVLAGLIFPTVFAISIFLLGGDSLSRIAPFFMLFIFSVFFVKPWELFTRITIDAKGIESNGVSTRFNYSWESIQSTEVFYTPKLKTVHYGIDFIGDTTYTGDDFKLEKRIFVSTEQIASPSWFSILDEKYLDFQYDEKAWRLINFYLAQLTEA